MEAVQASAKPASALPREHGAWAMLLQPFVGALLALRSLSWTVVPALACVLLVFLIREPLIVLARQRWTWREPHPETRQAMRRVLIELAGLLAAAALLTRAWPLWMIATFGAVATLFTALAVYITIHNRQREVWFQALSAAGLSGTCLAACLAITDRVPDWCWWWWLLHALHFLTGILVVHVRLHARIDARRSPNTLTEPFLEMRSQARRIQTGVAIAGLGLVAFGQYFYAAAMLFSAAVHFRDLASAHKPSEVALPMTTVGKRALAVSIVFTVLLIAAV